MPTAEPVSHETDPDSLYRRFRDHDGGRPRFHAGRCHRRRSGGSGGGRDGAILSGALGRALGTAINTETEPHRPGPAPVYDHDDASHWDGYPPPGGGKEGKEWRKHDREREREARKHHEEMEREGRKHYEEMAREDQKHREEMRRERRKAEAEYYRELTKG